MAQIITPIIQTAAGIGAAYGAGAANLVGGGVMGLSARRSMKQAADEMTKYKTLKNEIRQYKQAAQAKTEEHDQVLLEDSPSEEDPEDPYNPKISNTIEKIKTATDECFESALISRQLKQVEGTYRVGKANQASFYAQSAMGGAQVAVATSSIGHATFAVTMSAIGLSFVSALFYLGASIYGFAVAQKQLSENRQRQQDVLQAIVNIQGRTGKDYEASVSVDPDSEVLVSEEIGIDDAQVEMLKNTLKALKTEEAFLVQQRNVQAINAVAALMSLVAVCLFTAGTHGIGPIIYYVFLGASILLPLIAMGYSRYSMNETKYMKALQEQLDRSPLAWASVKIDKNTTAEALLELTIPLLNLEISDPDTRREVKALLEDFIAKLGLSNSEEQKEKLQELFTYLTTLQDRLIKEDLYCRLRIAGMKLSDLDS